MSRQAIVFTSNNARFVPFEKIEDLDKYKNVVLNPDTSTVAGWPPHYWKFHGGHIRPLEEEERAHRDRDLDLRGADNDVCGHDVSQVVREIEAEKKRKADMEEAKLNAIHEKIDSGIKVVNENVQTLSEVHGNGMKSVGTDIEAIKREIDMIEYLFQSNAARHEKHDDSIKRIYLMMGFFLFLDVVELTLRLFHH